MVSGGFCDFNSNPTTSNNEMLCVVIDKQERSVVYYKKQPSPMFNSHPTDYEDVSKMLHKLLKDFIK